MKKNDQTGNPAIDAWKKTANGSKYEITKTEAEIKFPEQLWTEAREFRSTAVKHLANLAFIRYASSTKKIPTKESRILGKKTHLLVKTVKEKESIVGFLSTSLPAKEDESSKADHIYIILHLSGTGRFYLMGGLSKKDFFSYAMMSSIVVSKEREMITYKLDTKLYSAKDSFFSSKAEGQTLPRLHICVHLQFPSADEFAKVISKDNEVISQVSTLILRRIDILKKVEEIVKAETFNKKSLSEEQRLLNRKSIVNDKLFALSRSSGGEEKEGGGGGEEEEKKKTRKKNDSLDCCEDDASFWYTCALLVGLSDDNRLKKWFMKQEVRLLAFRLSTLCGKGDEDSALDVMNCNKLESVGCLRLEEQSSKKRWNEKRGSQEDCLKQAEENFKERFPKEKGPKVWFSSPFHLATRCMKEMGCYVINGRCLLDSQHWPQFLETIFENSMKGFLLGKDGLGESQYNFIHFRKDLINLLLKHDASANKNGNGNTDLPSLAPKNSFQQMEVALTIIRNNLLPQVSIGSKSSLSRNQDLQMNLAPIEECEKFFPLCVSMCHDRIQEKGDLKHHQRSNYSGFLMECGFQNGEIRDYFEFQNALHSTLNFKSTKQQDKSNNGNEEEDNNNIVGKRPWTSTLKQSIDGKWAKTVSSEMLNRPTKFSADTGMPIPKTKSCQTLIDKPVDNDSNDGCYCPYKYFKDEELRALLISKGIPSQGPVIEGIMKTAKAQEKPQDACMMFLQYQFGKTKVSQAPPPPSSTNGKDSIFQPQYYFKRASTMNAENEKKRKVYIGNDIHSSTDMVE